MNNSKLAQMEQILRNTNFEIKFRSSGVPSNNPCDLIGFCSKQLNEFTVAARNNEIRMENV